MTIYKRKLILRCIYFMFEVNLFLKMQKNMKSFYTAQI